MAKARAMMTVGWAKRQAVWRHNSFIGSAAMMKAQCQSILKSETATIESKELADQIYGLAVKLRISLKTRTESK